MRLLNEGDRYEVGPGLHGNADPQARVNSIACVRRRLEQRGKIFQPSDFRGVHTIPVDREFDFMTGFEAAHDVQIRSIEVGLQKIFAVDREVVANSCAADRAERHAFDVLILRQVLTDPVRFAGCGDVGIADGERADSDRSG